MNWIKVWGIAFLIALLLLTSTVLYRHFHIPDVREGDIWRTSLYEDSEFKKSIDMLVVRTDKYYVEYAYCHLDTTSLWIARKKDFESYELISRKE